MTPIDMDAINFYKGPPSSADPPGGRFPARSSRNASNIGGQKASRPASRSRSAWDAEFDKYDLVEVLDLTDPSSNEPPRLLEESGTEISTHTEEVDVNELPADRGRDSAASMVDEDLPSLEYLFRDATEGQASQQMGETGETGALLPVRSDGYRDRSQDGQEIRRPIYGSNGNEGSIPCDDGRPQSCDGPAAVKDHYNTPGGPEPDDLYDAPREAGTDSIARGNDSSASEERSGRQSPPSTPSSSVAGSESGISTRPPTTDAPSRVSPRHQKSSSSSPVSSRIHDMTEEDPRATKSCPSSIGTNKTLWSDEEVEADGSERSGKVGGEENVLGGSTRKRGRPVTGTQPSLKRRVQRARPLSLSSSSALSSSSSSSEDEVEMEVERVAGSSALAKPSGAPIFQTVSSALVSGGLGEDSSKHADTAPKRRLASRAALSRRSQAQRIVSEEQDWEILRIVGKRWTGQGDEYQVCWKNTWLPRSELGKARRLLREYDAKRPASKSVKHTRQLGGNRA